MRPGKVLRAAEPSAHRSHTPTTPTRDALPPYELLHQRQWCVLVSHSALRALQNAFWFRDLSFGLFTSSGRKKDSHYAHESMLEEKKTVFMQNESMLEKKKTVIMQNESLYLRYAWRKKDNHHAHESMLEPEPSTCAYISFESVYYISV